MTNLVNKAIIVVIFFATYFASTKAQDAGVNFETSQIIEAPRYMRLMFYNCENLFDIYDDSLTNDEEFLPDGDKNWSSYRYYTKITQISKVITAVGGWKPPEIVGLCEIENRFVLDELTSKTQLYQFDYKIIHKESPDKRGIDVALLYQSKAFNPIHTEFLQVIFPEKNARSTRDILYTRGLTSQNDTLHIFVNHWPSRWGGQLESEERRVFTASLVRAKVDSIVDSTPNAYIFITGDLNDEPNNKSITETLRANSDLSSVEENELYSLSYSMQFKNDLGSHKYRGHWAILDHLVISGSLLNNKNSLTTSLKDAHILNSSFLLENDDSYIGKKPFRTYSGFRYLGGYSDHLPVFIDLHKKE